MIWYFIEYEGRVIKYNVDVQKWDWWDGSDIKMKRDLKEKNFLGKKIMNTL